MPVCTKTLVVHTMPFVHALRVAAAANILKTHAPSGSSCPDQRIVGAVRHLYRDIEVAGVAWRDAASDPGSVGEIFWAEKIWLGVVGLATGLQAPSVALASSWQWSLTNYGVTWSFIRG